MYYFYSNSKLIAQSTVFSEIFSEFFDTIQYVGLIPSDDSSGDVFCSLLSICVDHLISFSGWWYNSEGCEFAILTDLENLKNGKQKV